MINWVTNGILMMNGKPAAIKLHFQVVEANPHSTTTPSTIEQSEQGSATIPAKQQQLENADEGVFVEHTMEVVSSHSQPTYSASLVGLGNGNGSRAGASRQHQHRRKRKQSPVPNHDGRRMQTRSRTATTNALTSEVVNNDMVQNTRVGPSLQREMELGLELFTANTISKQNTAFTNVSIGAVKIEANYVAPPDIKTEIPEVQDSDIAHIESEEDDD